jgi:hypothetical protein
VFSIEPEDAGIRLRTAESGQEFFNGAVFSPSGRWLACDEQGMSGPSRCHLFELGKGALRRRHILHGAVDQAGFEFSKDERFLYGASYGMVMKWRVQDGKRLFLDNPGPHLLHYGPRDSCPRAAAVALGFCGGRAGDAMGP